MKGLKIVAKFPADDARKPAYYHSFGMTKNHFLFLEMPYRFNLLKILTKSLWGRNEPPSSMLEYHTDLDSIIKIANIETGENSEIKLRTKG